MKPKRPSRSPDKTAAPPAAVPVAHGVTAAALPLLAIVGRPNVGKSTLFNRLARSRRAIVGDEPGITRDRLYGETEWLGQRWAVVDTGGLLPETRELMPEAILRQAQVAIADAAVLLFVVDGRTELAAPDLQLARLLLRTGKPVLLLVNKIESDAQEAELGRFHQLGLEPLFPISAEHNRGLEAVLDAVLALAPPAANPPASEPAPQPAPEPAPEPVETAVAIIGRPNVGKSTLLNRMVGEERSIVSPVAGTTRDAVDALLVRGDTRYRVIDTAGIRRKGATRLMAEKLSVMMARKHLEQADIALLVLDGSEAEEEGVLTLDATIAGYAVEAQRSVVIVVNKWDRARALQRTQDEMERRIRDRLKFLAFAPIVFVSAQHGTGMERLFQALQRVARARRQRISTAEINRFLATVDFTRAPLPAGRRVRIYYLSQVAVAPPRFVLFVDRARPLHFSYQRFLENQLRRAFGFEGTPIVLKTRHSGGTGRPRRS